jgi:hypothetical protein
LAALQGVIECGNGARFSLESLAGFGRTRQVLEQNLYRDFAPEPRVARAIHFAHAACTERRDDLVWPKPTSWRKCQSASPSRWG